MINELNNERVIESGHFSPKVSPLVGVCVPAVTPAQFPSLAAWSSAVSELERMGLIGLIWRSVSVASLHSWAAVIASSLETGSLWSQRKSSCWKCLEYQLGG